MKCYRKAGTLIPMLVAAALLGGCGSGVSLEGKVFDWAGVSDKAKAKQKREPKLQKRAPLVLPPSVAAKLPEPGPQQVNAAPENWPDDPDLQRKKELAETKQKLEEYRRNGDFSNKTGMEEFRRIVNPLDRRPGLAAEDSKGIDISSEREASPDITEDIRDNVEFEKLKKATGVASSDPKKAAQENSWRVSKEELKRQNTRQNDSPDITDKFADRW
ncbi:MAG: hypothetical protein ACR2PO_03850 [Methyloligellaceae bacterium]